MRNVVGAEQHIDGRQTLDKLLCAQLHGQEAAKLHQGILALEGREGYDLGLKQVYLVRIYF